MLRRHTPLSMCLCQWVSSPERCLHLHHPNWKMFVTSAALPQNPPPKNPILYDSRRYFSECRRAGSSGSDKDTGHHELHCVEEMLNVGTWDKAQRGIAVEPLVAFPPRKADEMFQAEKTGVVPEGRNTKNMIRAPRVQFQKSEAGSYSVARGQASNLIPRDLKKPANNQGPTSGTSDCRWQMWAAVRG